MASAIYSINDCLGQSLIVKVKRSHWSTSDGMLTSQQQEGFVWSLLTAGCQYIQTSICFSKIQTGCNYRQLSSSSWSVNFGWYYNLHRSSDDRMSLGKITLCSQNQISLTMILIKNNIDQFLQSQKIMTVIQTNRYNFMGNKRF